MLRIAVLGITEANNLRDFNLLLLFEIYFTID